MKKVVLLIVNILIILGIFVFVVLYSHFDRLNDYNNHVVSFENMTLAMERITENYLQGEQSICDVWANYINTRSLTLAEATDFIRDSHVLKNTSAHLIYADTLRGLSTRSGAKSPGKYDVSYENVDVFGNMEWIADVAEAINISRAYTNPMNGEQSLAFINKIRVYDEASGGLRDALLLRIVPVSELEEKWVFPQTEFKNAEISVINANGDYIIKGRTFKSNNFFEFYKSYNKTTNADLQELKNAIGSSIGNFLMNDSKGHSCLIAHTPVSASEGWVMINSIENAELNSVSEDWIMIAVISVGLIFLLIINTFYMQILNKRLQQLAKKAEAANKAKTDFLSTMSHDIRTPMNAIIGLTLIAERSVDDRKTVSDSLRKISLAGNHLLTLINDILDISKVESGKIALNPMNFSLVDSVESIVNIALPMIKEKNIDFKVHIKGIDAEYLYADQMRLNQIYINILSNAIKYTHSGGSVKVDVIEEKTDVPGSVKLIYRVTDNGMGMSPEFMKVMFEPFTRQTDSRVNSIQGTGLGLTIIKKIADLMKGEVECESEQGKGTVFTVKIDIPVGEGSSHKPVLDPINVLIVDDDPEILDPAAETLALLGVHADKALGGSEAVELAKKGSYDVVIIDLKMPELDGRETARRIRSETGEDRPAILVSDYDRSEAESALKDGAVNGFVSKPLFLSTVYSAVSEILSKENVSVEAEDDYSDIAGFNVLIAEDNEINWEIINTLLEMYNVNSDHAENGRVCVEMLKAAAPGTYDLIFMDIQMPEMNGLDATRTIRKLDDPALAGIPIVAMTADAFSENVAECLNAGMNGHLAKPIDIELVLKEIRKVKEKRN